MDAFAENLQSAREYNDMISMMLQSELEMPDVLSLPSPASPARPAPKSAKNTELLKNKTRSSGLRLRSLSEVNVARSEISSRKASVLEDAIQRLQRDVECHREVEVELEAAMSAAAEAWLRDAAKKSAEPVKQVEVEDARLEAALDTDTHLKENLAVEVRFRGLAEEELATTRKELDAASNKLVVAAEKGEQLIHRIATLEADLKIRNLEADELRAELVVSRRQQPSSKSVSVMDNWKGTSTPNIKEAHLDASAELEEVLLAKQMADAQASMLRSCLEDTEDLLDESRSKVNLLEKKLKAASFETPADKNDEIEQLRKQAAEAESRVSAALEKLKSAEFEANLAKEGGQKMRLAAEAERDFAISAMEALLEEANKKLQAAGEVKYVSSPSVLRSAGARVETLTNELASAESRVSEKEMEVTALRMTSEVQPLRIETLESNLQALKSDLSSGMVDDNGRLSQLKASLEEKSAQVAAAEICKEALREEIKSLTRSLQEERAEKKVLLDNAEQAFSNSGAQIKFVEKKLENELRDSKRLTAELAASQLRVSQMRSDAQVAARSFAEAESELSDSRHRVMELETSLATFRSEAMEALQRKTDELVEASRAAADAEASKRAADGEIQRLNESLLKKPNKTNETSTDLVKLRESFAESEASRQSLRLIEADLKAQLEIIETSNAEREADYAAKLEQLTAKLAKSEESLKVARAETAKAEWSVSELKSQLQVDESRAQSKQGEIDKLKLALSEAHTKASDERATALKECTARQAVSDAKLVSAELECANLRGELTDTRLSVKQFTDAADSAKRRIDQLIADSSSAALKLDEMESRCDKAEDRASKAERSLLAFKEEANTTLKLKSEELVIASYALSQAEEAKATMEDEIKSLKAIVSRDEGFAADKTLRKQVVELREALKVAQEAQAGQQSIHTEFRLLLEATETATADRESEFQLQCKRFQDQVESAESRAQEYLANNAKMEWSMSILQTRVQEEHLRNSAKQEEIDGILKQVQELKLQIETTRTEADARIAVCESETLEIKELLATSRRELQEAQDASAKLAGELTAAGLDRKESAEITARLMSENESKCALAEARVKEVEAALSAFRIEANQTLESKTAELLLATLAAADAQTAKKSADAEVHRLKVVLQKYEEDKCLDSAIKAEVTELRSALEDALDAHNSQQSSLTELKLRLEAMENSTADREADHAAKQEQLTAKIVQYEDSLKVARADAAKLEWSVSELKSQLQVGTIKLKDAQDRSSSASTKLMEAEQELISTKLELSKATRLSEHSLLDLENVRKRFEVHVVLAAQLESKCADADQRASNAERALLAFKRETVLVLEQKLEEFAAAHHSDAEVIRADFQKKATVALERMTTELVLATRAAAEAESVNGSSIGNIDRVKQVLAKVEEHAAKDSENRVTAVRLEFTTEIDRLRDLLSKAPDSRVLEVEISSLRSELESAREAHVLQKALHDELRAQLDTFQGMFEAHESAAREELSSLRKRLEDKEQNLIEANQRQIFADAEISRLEASCRELEIVNKAKNDALSGVSSETQILMTAHIKRATVASERATQMASTTAAAQAEVAILKTRCNELESLLESEQNLVAAEKETLAEALAKQTSLAKLASDRASLLEASKISLESELKLFISRCAEMEQAHDRDEVSRLVSEIQDLQRNHAETLGVCETLREQLKLVAEAAENSNLMNKRHLEDTLAAKRLAESENDMSRNHCALLAEEISIARANVAALSAVRDSLESELAAKENIVIMANNARDQAIDEAQELRIQFTDLQRENRKLEMDAITKLEELSGEAQVNAASSQDLNVQLVEVKSQAENAARDAKLVREELEGKLRASSAELSGSRKEIERLTIELDKYGAWRVANVEQAKEELREETELMMQGAQREVAKALMESERLKRRLRASGARVAQLENEVIRLQKHEHALHALIDAGDALD
jgi:chromosome segregation ATPase